MVKVIVVENNFISPYDVDDTLIVWDYPKKYRSQTILIGPPGHQRRVLPHKKHIAMLKNAKARGHFTVVWSAGGYAWAMSIVGALGLTKYVDLVMCKPQWYTDDIPVEKWLTKRFYSEVK